MIRRAVVSDAGAMAAVLVDAWQTAYTGIIHADYPESLSTEKYTRIFSELLTDGADMFFVHENGESINGFVSGKIREDDSAEIVGVTPCCQRRGIGRSLLEVMTTHFRSCGVRDMIIWTLNGADNNRFYMSNGGVSSEAKVLKIGGKEYQGIGFVFDLK